MNVEPGPVSAGGGHPEIEEISALAEGVLPEDRGEAVAAHLTGCQECAGVHRSLDSLRALLGAQGPERMPDDIAGRIDAALVSEALLGASLDRELPREERLSSAGETAIRSLPASPHSPEHRPDGRYRSDGAGPEDTGRSGPGHSGRGTEGARTTGPARGPRSGRPPGPRTATRGAGRRRWPATLLATVSGAALLGLGILIVNTASSPSRTNAADRLATPGPRVERNPVGSTSYTDGNVKRKVRDLLSRASPAAPEGGGQEEQKQLRHPPFPSDGSARIGKDGQEAATAAASLPRCVLDATGQDSRPPLATDTARYQGTRVGVVVLPDGTASERVTVFLVDSSCASATPSRPGKVLLKRTLPRP